MNAQSGPFQSPPGPDELELGTGPIPAGPHYRPEYFALEREAVFKCSWLQVGHLCELPRDRRTRSAIPTITALTARIAHRGYGPIRHLKSSRSGDSHSARRHRP
jgi:hypothetical protein